jgi:hypothetical protein
MKRSSAKEIGSIFGNQPLASAIHRSVSTGLRSPSVHLGRGNTVWQIFKQSLDAAIRDIEKHPRGDLFRRLIEYGSHNPDEPQSLTSDGKTTLSDPECSSCVEFIHSHMINRFKGEIAELLAMEPCVKLLQQFYKNGQTPSGVHLYFGNAVKQRRRIRMRGDEGNERWGNFTKGADGLLVEKVPIEAKKPRDAVKIHGVVEIKSMALPNRRVIGQIDKHIQRLGGGVKLGEMEWPVNKIQFPSSGLSKGNGSNMIRVIVVPSTEKLSREWHSVKKDRGREIVFSEPSEPSVETRTEHLEHNLWKITLAWSQEALDQAAYEMTFWYMSQVGLRVYANKRPPKGWEYMTPEEAGRNSIKMMLYFINLRYISKREAKIATKLYNVYCFGYPLGIDSDELLWPEDFPEEDKKGQ